jgi:hypothetical protein
MLRQAFALLLVCLIVRVSAEGLNGCVNVTRDELSFCFVRKKLSAANAYSLKAVDYPVAIYIGENPAALDRQAQAAYLGQHDFGIQGGCNIEARNLICANFFPKCGFNGTEVITYPPCRKLCKDFKVRWGMLELC